MYWYNNIKIVEYLVQPLSASERKTVRVHIEREKKLAYSTIR